MPLQSSGAISLSDIQTEFGGSNPISLNEYYGAASGIPSSGTISMNQFYGTSSGPALNLLASYNNQFQTSATASWQTGGRTNSLNNAFKGQTGRLVFQYTSGNGVTGDFQLAYIRITGSGAAVTWQTDADFDDFQYSNNITDQGTNSTLYNNLSWSNCSTTNGNGRWVIRNNGYGTPSSNTGLTTTTYQDHIYYESSGNNSGYGPAGSERVCWLRSPLFTLTTSSSSTPGFSWKMGRYGAEIGLLRAFWVA